MGPNKSKTRLPREAGGAHAFPLECPYPLRAPGVIVFDWDGTLLDTRLLLKEAYLHTFSKLGVPPLPFGDTLALPTVSLKDLFPSLFYERWREAETAFYDYVEACHLDLLCPMDGAESLLSYLSKKEVILNVISNKRGDLLRKEVDKLGWMHYFHKVIGSRDYPEDKPSPVVVEACLQGVSRPKLSEKPWLVGDSLTDLEAAHRSDLLPVLLNTPQLLEAAESYTRPFIYVDSCLDLKNLLIHSNQLC